MRRMKPEKIVLGIVAGVSGVLLVLFLFWHLRLGMTRYFDADEFAHMHWASHFVMGNRPYVDFLMFFPPGFILFLAPLFVFGWGTTAPLLAGRVEIFIIFTLTCIVASLLFWDMRKSPLALMAGALLAFLPMPFDKYLEIRPDNLATLFVLIGMWLQIRWMRTGGKRWGFWSGICYALSLLVLPKMVPNVAVAAGIAVLAWRKNPRMLVSAGTGFVVPFATFGVWILTLGDIGKVFYSLTKLPLEANRISQYFIMMPDLFFYPNGIFYGENGYNPGLMTNHAVWIVGLCMGIYRLITPFLTRGKKHVWEELLIAGTFIVQVMAYVQIVPLKHTQYLIPIGVFVAWYAADGLFWLWEHARKLPVVGTVAYLVVFTGLSVYLYNTFVRINTPKLAWTNTEMLAGLSELYKKIPKTEYVLDLEGGTLYYPDPYYACCLPFGQFSSFLSQPLPSLVEALKRTQTKYIFQGGLMRTTTLTPQDKAYVTEHFLPAGDGSLLVAREK